MRSTASTLIRITVAGLLVACGGSGDVSGPQVSSVTVSPESGTLTAIGDTLHLSAVAKDASGAQVSTAFTWTAEPAGVATVSTSGVVTAAGNGTATITATAGGVSGTATLTVAQQLSTIAVSSPVTTFRTLGRKAQLAAQPRDANGNAMSGVSLTWSSSNTGTLSVSASGEVTAGNNGTATLSATAGTVTGTVDLTVSQLATALDFTRQPAFARPGATLDSVAVTVVDSGGSRVRPATPTVTLAFGVNPRSATLGGTTQAAADSGRASFTTLTINRAAVGYTLRATATGLAPDTSQPFDVFLPFMAVDGGFSHSCGITRDSLPYCWGLADSGRLGSGSTGVVAQPAAVTGGLKLVAVSAGAFHTCGLTAAGTAYCWGGNGSGQLGDGNGGTDSASPVAVSGGLTFRSIAAGFLHTCAVTTSNAAYCWGYNLDGELGDNNPLVNSDVPVPVSGGHAFQSVATLNFATCAVTTTGDAYCWGPNDRGILGNGTTGGSSAVPVKVSGGLTFAAVSGGVLHACGVTTSGAGYCWGADDNGRLGDGGANADTNAPSAVAGGLSLAAITAGSRHTCGLTTAGAAYCWGAASNGELGNGDAGTDRSSPVAVIGGLTFARIAASGHTCALTGAGAAYCWGADFEGQLGDGPPQASSETPRLVIEP